MNRPPALALRGLAGKETPMDHEVIIYSVTEGRFYDYAGPLLYKCYSGKRGIWCNNPEYEAEANYGPIPRGRWTFGAPYHSAKTGPLSIPLIPAGHDAWGRSGFLIHGDNAESDASQGCIVAPRALRGLFASALADGRKPTLYVVSSVGLRPILER